MWPPASVAAIVVAASVVVAFVVIVAEGVEELVAVVAAVDRRPWVKLGVGIVAVTAVVAWDS